MFLFYYISSRFLEDRKGTLPQLSIHMQPAKDSKNINNIFAPVPM